MQSLGRGIYTCPGLQIPQDFPGKLPWDYEIQPFFTQNHTELLEFKGTSGDDLIHHLQAFLFSLLILQGLPAIKNVHTNTSENRMLMDVPQVTPRHDPEWHCCDERADCHQNSRCDVGRAVSLLHFHEIHPHDWHLAAPFGHQLRSPSSKGRRVFWKSVSPLHCICDIRSVTQSCSFSVRHQKPLAEMVSEIQFLFVGQNHFCILAFSCRGAVNFVLIFRLRELWLFRPEEINLQGDLVAPFHYLKGLQESWREIFYKAS